MLESETEKLLQYKVKVVFHVSLNMLCLMFSKILGLTEVKFELKIFAFSNLFVFPEEVLRSENVIPQKYFKFRKKLHTSKNFVLIGQNLPPSWKLLINSKM